MPVARKKLAVQVIASVILVPLLIILLFFSFGMFEESFEKGRPSVCLVLFSWAGITGSVWLYIMGKKKTGIWLLVLFVLMFILVAWLGTPIKDIEDSIHV